MKALRLLLALTLAWFLCASKSRADAFGNRAWGKSAYQSVITPDDELQTLVRYQENPTGYGEIASGREVWTKFDPLGLSDSDGTPSPSYGQMETRLNMSGIDLSDPNNLEKALSPQAARKTPDMIKGISAAAGVAGQAIVIAQPSPSSAAAPEEAALGSGISAAPKSPGLLTRVANAVADFFGVGEDATAAAAPTGSAKAAKGLQPYEVDTFGGLTKRELVGDGLDKDHQPSKAALIAAATDAKGAPLTDEEEKAVINNGIAVAVPKDVHMAGPTYAGKNTPAQIATDKTNLPAAATRDSNAMVQNAAPADKAAAQQAANKVQAAAASN